MELFRSLVPKGLGSLSVEVSTPGMGDEKQHGKLRPAKPLSWSSVAKSLLAGGVAGGV